MPALPAPLAPLRHRPFLLLTLGRATDLLGNSIAPTALAFAVLDLTGSVSDLGLVVGARSLFNVLFLLFGGVLADRLPRHLVQVGANLLSAATQAGAAALLLGHAATLPLLVALASANGVFAAIGLPASAALVPQTVPDELRVPANALNRIASNSARIVGASVGGVIVAYAGSGWGLGADALTFLLSALCFAGIRLPAAATAATAAGGGGPASGGALRELRLGWVEFTSRTWVWTVVVAFTFLNAAIVGTMQVLGPATADLSFGRRDWGFVLAAVTAGNVVGGVVALRLRPRRMLLVGCACMAAEALLPLGLASWAGMALLVPFGFVAGLCVEQFGIAWETSLQQEVPQELLARVYSYDMVGSFIGMPIANIAVGPLAGAIGLRPALLAAAAVIVVGTLAMTAVPDIRGLRIDGPAVGSGGAVRVGTVGAGAAAPQDDPVAGPTTPR